MSDFRVVLYSRDNLLNLFAELAGSRREDVEDKLHSIYFPEYFDHLGAKTILVEFDYVDRDYLEDYAGYYVRCFSPPKPRCGRLHFFQADFDEAALISFLEQPPSRDTFLQANLNDSQYLGFIVVKPLAQTFIGRTCLRTYANGASGRHFPSLRPYEVNLFGVHLSVNSLAFQEQDTEVARCATAAMWSVLQGTAIKFGHAVPTPVEITKNAVAVHANRSRTLPAKDGLTIEQLADAVRKMGLEPYCVAATTREILQAEAYAYLRASIPALLGIALVDMLDQNKAPLNPPELVGLHAVSLTGYHISDQPPTPFGKNGLLLRATRIDKFYAHDDQVGAFARMTLSPAGQSMHWSNLRGGTRNTYFMECSWSGRSGEIGSIRAIPENLLIPLYPKMRIPFQEALKGVASFDSVIMELQTFGLVQMTGRLEWDIFLTTSAELKDDLLKQPIVSGSYGRELLSSSMPRFIWRAIGLHNDTPCVELLFDATDIVQGTFFLRAIEHESTLLALLRNPAALGFATSTTSRTILEWFAAN